LVVLGNFEGALKRDRRREWRGGGSKWRKHDLGLTIHRVQKKRPQFSRHNFNKCRHSSVIFGTNHPEDSFY